MPQLGIRVPMPDGAADGVILSFTPSETQFGITSGWVGDPIALQTRMRKATLHHIKGQLVLN
jgi:hypothetical protein